MPARSRKRGRHGRRPAATTAPAAPPTAPASPTSPAPPSAPEPSPTAGAQTPAAPAGGRSRSEERNEAIRAGLAPLAPGERPWPLLVSTVLAVLVAVSNIVQAAVGGNIRVGGGSSSVGGAVPFALVMLVCAFGMWRLRYWAVLGFMALLAIVIITFAFVAVTANDVLRLIIAITIMGAGGFLFWKLVRVLSRLQMPSPSRSGGGKLGD